MENEKVPGIKISALIALLLVGSSVTVGGGSWAEQDSWIAMAAATAGGLLLAWLYSAVLRLHPGKDMFDIFIEVTGSVCGKVLCWLYVVYAVFTGAQIFALYDNFLQIINLDKTPTEGILLISVPLVAVLVKCGPRNMGSCAEFLFAAVVLMTGGTLLFGLSFMNLNNIKPVLGSGIGSIAQSAGFYLTLPIGESVLAMSFFGEINQKESPFRILALGILFGGVLLTVFIVRNVLLLGAPTCNLFLFASYEAVGIVSVGDFVTRISAFIGIELTLAGIAKLSVFTYTASVGVSKALGLKKFMQPAACCCAFMAALSMTLYTNIQSEVEFEKYSSLVGVPLQIVLPLIILVTGKIRLRKKKKGAAKKAAHAGSTASPPKEPAL